MESGNLSKLVHIRGGPETSVNSNGRHRLSKVNPISLEISYSGDRIFTLLFDILNILVFKRT